MSNGIIASVPEAPAAKDKNAQVLTVNRSDISFRSVGAALCANIHETTASSFITVEGQEVSKDGRSQQDAR